MPDLKEQLDLFGHAEVLVVLKPEKRVREDGRLSLDLATTRDLQQEAAGALTTHFSRFESSREVIMARELRQQPNLRSAQFNGAPKHAPRARSVRYFPNLGVMLGTVDKQGYEALSKDETAVAKVEAVTDFGLISPQPTLALAAEQPLGISWGIERLGIRQLWDQGHRGQDITIGHVDTGVDGSHPALEHAIDSFAEFDLVGEQVVNAKAWDSGHHGTHTAGIMVGRPHNGLTFGVAPEARLASAMVIEYGRVAARLLAGLDFCVSQGVKIVNISLGLRGYDGQFEDIIRLLRQRDILPVVAIGNEGPKLSRSPGNYRDSLSVGAMDEMDQVWVMSSSQKFPPPGGYNKPDILGPGVEIWSSVPGGKLRSLSGTSMSTPHIAGLAAVLWSARPHARMAEIEAAIFKSASRPPAIGTERGNRGVPNGPAALNFLP